jgi:N-acetylmuramoyl-L-alanine amidase
MRLFFITITILLISEFLFSDVVVRYRDGLSDEIILTKKIDNLEYFNVFELNKAFKAVIREDVLDYRLHINLYNEQLIFLLDSSYLQHRGKQYNFLHPLHQDGDRYFLPINFLYEVLPVLLDDVISRKGSDLLAANPTDNRIKTIVLDPGHGGKDPGAIGASGKIFEKDITLAISKKLQKVLQDNLDVEVLLTRSKNEFVSLQQRTEFANKQNAGVFISIHCNAHRDSKIDGIEVFYLSTAITDEARAVEALENQVVYDYEGGAEAVKKYDDLAFILADMAQSEHLEESFQLGLRLQNNLISAVSAKNRGVKQANFYVLRGAFMPSVLAELGFLSNKEEEKKLIKSSYQDKLVEALYLGIKDFIYKYEQMQ